MKILIYFCNKINLQLFDNYIHPLLSQYNYLSQVLYNTISIVKIFHQNSYNHLPLKYNDSID